MSKSGKSLYTPSWASPWSSPWRAIKEDDWPTPQPVSVEAWRAAEAAHGRSLARAATAFARLDERLRCAPLRPALLQRLSALEATNLAGGEGALVSIERVALDQVDRLSGEDREAAALERIHWAIRRLSSPARSPFENYASLCDFLQRRPQSQAGDASRFDSLMEIGGAGEARFEAWRAHLEALEGLHPFTRAAAAYQAWRALSLGAPGGVIEPGVIAARLASGDSEGGAPFAPVALSDRHGVATLSGDATERLRRWLILLTEASTQARLHTERLTDWAQTAQVATQNMKGDTPARLIDLLLRRPALSAPMAAKALNRTPAAMRTALKRLEAISLIEEMTGQGRFRYWRAAA